MTKLTWAQSGQRFYEAGVDRGVFYPRVGSGVAWSGLIAVNENVSGGAVKSVYLDGQKRMDFMEGEDFQADIEAYSAPAEFNECDGIRAIANGLFVTQQPRATFGFSYRTLRGNDIQGSDFGYKLHLVYNATASPSSRTNQTIGAQADPLKLKWAIDTVPPDSSTYKPSAHLVVDSKLAAPAKLAQLEALLYGTTVVNAALPTQSAVYAIFSAP